MAALLASRLPLAADPFPPTHVAGSSFEGFFVRLQSHSGASFPSLKNPASPRSPSSSSSPDSLPSPSPRRQLPTGLPATPPLAGGASPQPSSPLYSPATSLSHRRIASQQSAAAAAATAQESHDAPGDLILVICELQSAPPEQRICVYMRWIAHGEESSQAALLQRRSRSAVSSKLHEIGHGISPASSSTSADRTGSSDNGSARAKGKQRQSPDQETEKGDRSFEIVHYLPRWKLKVGAKADASSVQPFRVELSSNSHVGEMLGWFEVSADGNVHVDITLPRSSDSSQGLTGSNSGGTRVKIDASRQVPWSAATDKAGRRWFDPLPIGSRGPEGLLQHLGLLLPLHWYVFTSQSPATYSIQHVDAPYRRRHVVSQPASPSTSRAAAAAVEGGERGEVVSSGAASVHVEKNWGQGFPTGWLWCQASGEVASPSADGLNAECPGGFATASERGEGGAGYFASQLGLDEATTAAARAAHHPTTPVPAAATNATTESGQDSNDLRVSLAGGSILFLTAFLVGIRIPSAGISWDFRPPFAVGPGFAVEDSPRSYVNYGLGFKIRRDFGAKTVRVEVWDVTRWARIEVSGDDATFATRIPGPVPGGWTAGYCHHSYRCRMVVTLFRRPWSSIPSTLIASTLANPSQSWKDLSSLFRWPSTVSPNKISRPDTLSASASQSSASGLRQRRKARRTASMDPDPRLEDLEEESEEDEEALQARARSQLDQAWCRTFGWSKIGQWTLDDRVALEFGGHFAR